MKLRFIYAPVPDLAQALPFYRDLLGWSEAWRESADTVAFQLPESSVQVMVTVQLAEPPGPMYQVDSVAEFLADRPQLTVAHPPRPIPDGSVAGVADPAGNILYIFDQARSQPD